MVTARSVAADQSTIRDPWQDCQRAFDAVAPFYDGPVGNNSIIQRFRTRLRRAVIDEIAVRPATLLDLGCGPGQDAEFFARQGHAVTAIDWSPGMVAEARERVARAGLEPLVTVKHVGIQQLEQLSGMTFDVVYSDLGPLNCLADLSASARMIFGLVRSGGCAILSVIGRVCPWELALFTLKGRPDRARVRFARTAVAVPLDTGVVWTRYYSPGECRTLFEKAGFVHGWHRALGLLVPPPYLAAFAERHPGFIDGLQRVEDRVAAWPLLRGWGDHFLLVMRKP